MLKYVVALAIAGAISAPLAAESQAQAQPQTSPEAAQTAPAQPQTVTKKKCRRVPDYQSSGTMLGPSHLECKTVEVPVKANGVATAQPTADSGSGGKK